VKFVRSISIAFGALLLMAIGVSVQSFRQSADRFDLDRDPITRQIKQLGAGNLWETRVPLVPEPFSLKADRTDPEHELTAAGFSRDRGDNLSAGLLQQDVDGRREIYSPEGNTLVCNIQFYVIVAFDSNSKLSFAEGAEYEHGCS
jgi:hypothetical protein